MQLSKLLEYGQSAWLDTMRRHLLTSGELERLRDEGIRGVTSNPTIFEKAFAGSDDYDEALRSLEEARDRSSQELYEILAVEDLQGAADVLRPIYDESDRADGYASLEVSPHLAHDTEGTIEEARRLWRRLDRRNVMIKVPATPEGIPAIRRLIAEGVNVNVTLLFSESAYEGVVAAYLAGLEEYREAGGDPGDVASVASIFVSRFDVMVDPILERLADARSGEEGEAIRGLVGKVGIANARRIYRAFRRVSNEPRFERLARQGARPQRILFASTSTKDPRFRDVLYVESLIGPDTVDTLPPATLEAFRDHGEVGATLERDPNASERVLESLEHAGVSLVELTDHLLDEGVDKFARSFDKLLATIEERREGLLGPLFDRTRVSLPEPLEDRVKQTISSWQDEGRVQRLWQRDSSLWTGADERQWLDWLRIADGELADADPLWRFAEEVRGRGFRDVVVLGMGGSSLFADVLSQTFPRQPEGPALRVLDSTDPAQIGALQRQLDLERTLFIVSSKSGSTLEPNLFEAYFFDQLASRIGEDRARSQFVAVTDPGSPLEAKAKERGYLHVFHGLPGIGGRYSALSDFGMIPAAAMGLDVGRLLDSAQRMAHACAACVPAEKNPGVMLGAVLGNAAANGRDKITIVASPPLRPFGAWLEQLLAESTGKRGKGLIPVDLEPLGGPEVYGGDRVFAYLRHDREADPDQDAALEALAAAGHPVVRIAVRDIYDLTQEVFRWEMATAVAGAILRLNPFDQPDVEASKEQARQLTGEYEETGRLPEPPVFFRDQGIALFAAERDRAQLEERLDGRGSLAGYLRAHFDRVEPGDYLALLAWIERNQAHARVLEALRVVARDRLRVATCLGFGPRFLHSTGQAYKGGPPSGVFLHIVAGDSEDLAVPGRRSSFGVVKQAQAEGDFRVLTRRRRRILGIDLGDAVDAGLEVLLAAVKEIV